MCTKGSCGKEFNSRVLLLFHQYENSHLGVYCCMCDKNFSTAAVLRRHVKSSHLQMQEQYVCPLCPDKRTFGRKDNFHRHQRQLHGVITCEYCGTGFTDGKFLAEHISAHHAM